MEAIGVQPYRTKVKRRKASGTGESAPSDEARYLLVFLDVMATGWLRSLNVLPWEICGAPANPVGPRTNERRLMAQQKSENCTVPEGRGNSVSTHGVEPPGGGKAIPVYKSARQLALPFATAACPQGAAGDQGGDLSPPASPMVPKANDKSEPSPPVTMKGMTERLTAALLRVVSNKGAPGPNGQTVTELYEQWDAVLPKLTASLVNGTYRVGEIRRVLIPKPGGGERGLGIPDVVDRVVQEAVRQTLEPLYEPTFHPSSHGFRPDRSCHTAITEAVTHLEDGRTWVVDLDLEKFFDRVCHQRLMARLAQRVHDRQLLVLIGQMLKAEVVMPDGVVVPTEEGVPQGGPLSPLLSNIVLDELDWELDRRKHRFVRYADDVNIFVGSERAGQRAMASITRFIEGRLRLKVNASKSAVARPGDRHFLGFSLRVDSKDGTVKVMLSRRTLQRATRRLVELTPRSWGSSFRRCISQINVYLRGWYGFFGICSSAAEYMLRNLDARLRRRLRAIQLRHWKCKRTIARNLIRRGLQRRTAWRSVYAGRQSLWALSNTRATVTALPNKLFTELGLVSLVNLHRLQAEALVAPKQLTLFGTC